MGRERGRWGGRGEGGEGVQGDTLAPFLFITFLNYALCQAISGKEDEMSVSQSHCGNPVNEDEMSVSPPHRGNPVGYKQ